MFETCLNWLKNHLKKDGLNLKNMLKSIKTVS